MGEYGVKEFGNKKTEQMFLALPEKAMRRSVRKATNAVNAVVRKELRKEMPQDTGDSKKAVASKTSTSKDKQRISGIVGEDRRKVIDGEKPARRFHLIENGYIARDGSFVPGQFPLLRAWNNTKSQREAAYGSKLMQEVEKETAKLGAKGNER